MTSSNSVIIALIFLVFVRLGSAMLLDDGCKPVIKSTILFGENASPAPWMAYLIKDGTFICSGTLISHFFALTAAHCADSTKNFIVRLGEYNTTDDIPSSDFQVNRILKHWIMDIALLKLHKDVRYSEYIKPICILSSKFYNKLPTVNTFFVTGWGTTSDLNKRSSSTVLQQMLAKRLHPPECDKIEGEICCGHPSDDQFICGGDSGAPLVAYVKYNRSTTITAQYGVVRGTSELCRDHAYYVDVNELSWWIFSEVRIAEFDLKIANLKRRLDWKY